MTLTSPGKILITGPGRSGTTFVVQLLTRLGLDTGFTPYREPTKNGCRAGCEWDVGVSPVRDSAEVVRRKMSEAPTIMKSCEWGLYLKWLVRDNGVQVDHVIVPIRDLEDAARSRLEVGLDWLILDGLNEDEKLINQLNICAIVLGRVIETCFLYNIPCTLMRFPTLVEDEQYCYKKLNNIFDLDRGKFYRIFNELSTRVRHTHQEKQWYPA